MEILQGLNGLRCLEPDAVVSIGNFDGVHRGHQEILRRARELCAGQERRRLAVVTFEPHPLTVLRPGTALRRLTPPVLKEALLCHARVDYLVVLPPERPVLDMTAEDFWGRLREDAKPSWLVEGGEFNFGKDRGGTVEKLRSWAKADGVGLEVVDDVEAVLLDLSVVQVSSTLVRWLLAHGRVRDAGICLGRPYVLEGEVVKGCQRGREIGVPTANLQCADQLVPGEGVYAGRCRLGAAVYPAALSIGTMPTFGGDQRQIEAYLVGFSGDLYGQTLRVELLDWVRDQRKFEGAAALKVQLDWDIEAVGHRNAMEAGRDVEKRTANLGPSATG